MLHDRFKSSISVQYGRYIMCVDNCLEGSICACKSILIFMCMAQYANFLQTRFLLEQCETVCFKYHVLVNVFVGCGVKTFAHHAEDLGLIPYMFHVLSAFLCSLQRYYCNIMLCTFHSLDMLTNS